MKHCISPAISKHLLEILLVLIAEFAIFLPCAEYGVAVGKNEGHS
jgi:hypothetical protein